MKDKMYEPKILGVCARIAEYLGANVTAIRWLVFIAGLFLMKEVIITYLVLAVVFSMQGNRITVTRKKIKKGNKTVVKKMPKYKDNDEHNYMDY
jgi:phage shock protein PspC (stress-responsive transcriptional regulator)